MLNEANNPASCKTDVSGWHFLPETPEINKEVLVAVKYDNEPVQAFWIGKLS